MPANVGKMFYTGEVPWHGQGLRREKPATVDEAIRDGGLDWEVGLVDLLTDEHPPSSVLRRKAIVRSDRAPGVEGRVVGVVHPGFQPVQNRDGALLLDSIFGQGKPVYHTGGYLGDGGVVWLLAAIDKTIHIGCDDIVAPYALFANSHDGTMALNISLTTVRVVCQNTLQIALKEKGLGVQFRRVHHGSVGAHSLAAESFFAATLREIDNAEALFSFLSRKGCDDLHFVRLLDTLLPERPANADRIKGVEKTWETRREKVRAARAKIIELREGGRGVELATAKGTYWGALNAVTEFVDHHQQPTEASLANAVFGEGRKLKQKALEIIVDMAQAA